MMGSRLKYSALIFLAIGSLLFSCDTSNSVEDPNQNFFYKYYGGDGEQEGVDVVAGPDGSIYLFGNSTPPGTTFGKQLYLVKTDANGILMWEKTFGGKFDDEAKDIELLGGQLVILANSQKGSAENDILLMTFSLDGNKGDSVLVGLKTDTGAEADDRASTISQTNDGFIVSGSTTAVNKKPNGGAEDITDVLHLRFASNLTIFDEAVWSRTYGTIGTDGGSKVYQVDQSTYYVFGYSNVDIGTGSGVNDFNFWIYQLGATGVPSKNQMYPGAVTTDEVLTSVITPPVGSTDGFLLAGTSENTSNNFDIYINKLRQSLLFNPATDYQINKPLSVNLGKLDKDKARVSAYASSSSGYLLLANEKTLTSNNFLLTKITLDGQPEWSNPSSLIFGGQKDDVIGAVSELPDGKILLVGTMELGDEGQKKMALIKVNKDGKFLN